MIAPNHEPPPLPPGGTRKPPFYRRWRLPLWLAICLVPTWMIAGWLQHRASKWSIESRQESFSKYVDQQFIYFDAWHARINPRPELKLFHWSEKEFVEDFYELYEFAEKHGRVSGEMWLELALVHHWLKDSPGVEYDNVYDLLVRDDVTGKEPIYEAVFQLWEGAELREEYREYLIEHYKANPQKWSLAYLANLHGFTDRAAQAANAGRRDLLFFGSIGVNIVMSALTLFSFIMLWKWRSWLPAAPMSGSYQRWVSRWSVTQITGSMLAIDLLGKVLAFIFGLAATVGIHLSMGSYMTHYAMWWAIALMGFALSVITTALWPYVMIYLHMPGWHRFRQEAGLVSAEMLRPHYWLAGVAGASLIFFFFWLIEITIHALGGTWISLSGIDRNMDVYGYLALPFTILWGCILAPLVEEIIFRGFLFRVIQNKWGTAVGMILSSLVFGWGHFYDAVGFFYVFAYGIIFCLVYQRTGKLAAPIILHCCVNSTITVFKIMGDH